MSTPEEIAELIERDHREEIRMANKLSGILTKVLEQLGLANDQNFRSKVARALLQSRLERIQREKNS